MGGHCDHSPRAPKTLITPLRVRCVCIVLWLRCVPVVCPYFRCVLFSFWVRNALCGKARLKRDGAGAETRFRLSPKRTSPYKSAGASVQSTAGSRVVPISGSNAGYTTFRGSVRILATHSIRQFPLYFPSRASPFAIRFQTHYKTFVQIVTIARY